MSVPNIDTFEHDVAEEIKKKEASFTDIASAGGTVENAPEPKRASGLYLILGGAIIVLVMVTIAAAYLFVSSRQPIPPEEVVPASDSEPTAEVSSVSRKMQDSIGSSLGIVTRHPQGYAILIKNYTPVYAYMLRKEGEYADELAASVGSSREVGTSSLPFAFKDTTVSNQNMRVGTSGSSTVIYAFVDDRYLLISSTTEGILSLRGAILK